MNHKVFVEAAKKCTSPITRSVIEKLLKTDTTQELRKYLKSYGIMQLAQFLAELSTKNIRVSIDSNMDVRQKKRNKQPTIRVNFGGLDHNIAYGDTTTTI